MRRLATAFSLLALAAAPAAEAQFLPNYSFTTNFTASGANERGIAYNPATNHLLLSSRNGGNFAYIYDSGTGSFLNTAGNGSGSLNTTGITGGTVALNDIEATDDGHIYGCNLTLTNINGTEFKCYHWTNETAAPDAVTLTGIPSAVIRLGDRIRVTGSGATGIHLWHATQTAPITIYHCTSSSYTAFACNSHDAASVGATGASGISVSPDPRPHATHPADSIYVWFNGNSVQPRLLTIPTTGNTRAYRYNVIPATQLYGSGTGNGALMAFQNQTGDSTYVAIMEWSTSAPILARGRIVNVTTMTKSSTVGVVARGVTASAGGVSTGASGDVILRPISAPAARKGDNRPSAMKVAAASYDLIVMGPNNAMVSAQTSGGSLPVELVNFAGVASGSTARLSWQTTSETNNLGFTVERLQGDNWSDASTLIAGYGTTTEVHAYTFDVNGLAPGTHTFRLRQTDTDGSLHYSPNVTVEIALETDYAVTLLGQRAVRVSVQEPQAVTVRVFDVLGRAVATLRTGDLSGTVDVLLPGSLASGSYLVRVEGERFATTKNLVVR